MAGKAGAKAAVISIRPPHEGRDPSGALPVDLLRISIHPPRVGRDQYPMTIQYEDLNFNPPPVWGGTKSGAGPSQRLPDFNPPSPYGGGTVESGVGICAVPISIHPPREGRDFSKIGTTAGIVAGFHPMVGNLFPIVVSQIIDPQAVLLPVHNGHKFCLQSPQNTTLHRSRHTYSPEMNHSQASTEICPVPTPAISSMWQNFFESPLLYSANFANHSFRTLLR